MDRNAAIGKLDDMISKGRASMQSALTSVVTEWEARKDYLVRPESIDYLVEKRHEGLQKIRPVIDNETLRLTGHSESQLFGRAAIPNQFANKLLSMGEGELLKTNLKALMPRVSGESILVRRVGDLAKGIMSSSYKRMDAGPVFQSFVEKGIAAGYVPHRGSNTDRVYNLSMLDQQVYEPTPDEFMVYGINIQTSDYGSGALEFNMMMMRIVCANLSVGMDVLRKVHLGSRFNMGEHDGPVIEISNRTHELDARAIASGIGDAVTGSRGLIEGMNKAVDEAIGREIRLEDQIRALRKRGMRKEFAEKVATTFKTDLPIEMLPRGNNAWRLSNTISLLAQSEEDADRRLDYEREAFNLLNVKAA
jgi:hypothetical protein